MALYKDKNNGIHDDMGGAALPYFPDHLGPFTPITQEQAAAIRVEQEKPKTHDEIIAITTSKIQQRLDNFAKSRNYDGILSACTYATSGVPKFAAEGQYCVDKRDETWATGYEIMAAVQSDQRPMPTWEEIESELPELVWPN